MTQPQDHAQQAEDCLRLVGGDLSSGLLIARAQVHATLALAEAVRKKDRPEPITYHTYVTVPEGMDASELAEEVSRRLEQRL